MQAQLAAASRNELDGVSEATCRTGDVSDAPGHGITDSLPQRLESQQQAEQQTGSSGPATPPPSRSHTAPESINNNDNITHQLPSSWMMRASDALASATSDARSPGKLDGKVQPSELTPVSCSVLPLTEASRAQPGVSYATEAPTLGSIVHTEQLPPLESQSTLPGPLVSPHHPPTPSSVVDAIASVVSSPPVPPTIVEATGLCSTAEVAPISVCNLDSSELSCTRKPSQ